VEDSSAERSDYPRGGRDISRPLAEACQAASPPSAVSRAAGFRSVRKLLAAAWL